MCFVKTNRGIQGSLEDQLKIMKIIKYIIRVYKKKKNGFSLKGGGLTPNINFVLAILEIFR